MRANEAMLIERCQRGDATAINDLLLQYQNKAQWYALKMTRNSEEAADLVSEAFIRASRAIGRFRLDSSFSTWLHTILRNCFLDMRKTRSVRPVASLDAPVETTDGDWASWQPIDESESPFETISKKRYSEAVHQALRLLPPRQRMLVLLYHKEELSYEEIADRLGTPVGTVKSRMNRARLNLRRLIHDNPDLLSQITE